MNKYRLTWASGASQEREASDMRTLLSVIAVIEHEDEPVKVELVTE